MWQLDCGLCAIKNITNRPDITLDQMLALLVTVEVRADSHLPSHLYIPDSGNFSGGALKMLLESEGYTTANVSGQVDTSVELMCLGFGRRLVGALWRQGEVSVTGKATSGHWLGMSYEHDPARSVAERHWHLKDSLHAGTVERVSWDGAVAKLKAADEAMCDLFLVLDCA